MQYWKQVYKIVFPKLNITFENSLHIGFSIEKDTTKESNKAKLEIYNLSEAHGKRSKLLTRKSKSMQDTKKQVGQSSHSKGL